MILNEPRQAATTLESGSTPKDFDWMERTTRLKFVLGEFCLFTLPIPCYALKAHFLRLPKELAEPEGVLKNMDPRLQAVFLPSYPVEAGLARFASGPHAIRYVPVQYHRFYIEIGGSFNEYL